MKSKLLNVLLLIMVFFLICGVGIFGMAIYLDFTDDSAAEDMVYTLDTIALEEPEDEETNATTNQSSSKNNTSSIQSLLSRFTSTNTEENTALININENKTAFFYNQLNNDYQKIIFQNFFL